MPSAIQQYVTRDRSLETVWRSIILFGRNVASYKFALGKSLLELGKGPNDRIRLEDLAVPFARHICAHLKEVPRQCTSQSSRFLAECRRFIRGEIAEDQLRLATARLGFENVIDAFHVVGTGEVPFRFFVDERSEGGGIRVTEDLRRVVSGVHAPSLEGEVESRWRLVEAAWELGMPPMVLCDPADHSLFAEVGGGRRRGLTGCRTALNGYQRGRCFYCAAYVEAGQADVDHFLPRILMDRGVIPDLDNVWNLVLACRACNRGEKGKFARVPALHYLQRLSARGEYLIASHHPLRETLIRLTGNTLADRKSFLEQRWRLAFSYLHHPWSAEGEVATAW